ncbi:MAG: putative DNA-binding domain-containing protein, partial [Planctomycetota bacterium]
AGMYFLRLHEALIADFPGVQAVLGEAGFEKLAKAYVARHPSRHPSLNHLGDLLPGFLATARVKKRALARDVARLELAMTQVFDAPRAEPLDTKTIEAVAPEAWATARLRLAPAFQLVALDHSVNALVTAVRRGDALPKAPRKKSWVAVYRKDFAVWRMDLSEPMFRVLGAFARGATLGQAIAAARIADANQVFAWFQDWRREGFFVGLEVSRPRTRRPAAGQQRRASRGRV